MGADDRTQYTPVGWPTVTPRIVAHDAAGLVRFIRAVFDARGEYRAGAPAVLSIGDSRLMVSDAGERGPVAAFLYVYVADADRTYRRAIAAGARSIEAPLEVAYGDRRAMVEDAWGNVWQIATRLAAAPGDRP
jgi:uncharacterized glyoxalase superfamily protein PhnB